MKGYVYKKNDKYEEIKSLQFVVSGWVGKNANFQINLLNEKEELIDSLNVDKRVYEHLKNQTKTFTQCMEYILRKLKFDFEIIKYERDTIWYYSRKIELSRRKIYNDIIVDLDLDKFLIIAKVWLERFCLENHCNIELLGTNQRHCVIEDNAYYKVRYEELRERFNKWQDKLVDTLNEGFENDN